MAESSSATRLSLATLSQARPGTVLPTYERSKLRLGIVHLGLGAFVRAHLATYVEDVLAREMAAWGIAGVSLKRPDQRDKLGPQDGLYTSLERDGSGVSARIIGCVKKCLVAPEDPESLLAMMTDRAARIISLTVTEKGYCHDPATGKLDEYHPDIVHDLETPERAALGRRHHRGSAGAPALGGIRAVHGAVLRQPPTTASSGDLVRDFAALRDGGLRDVDRGARRLSVDHGGPHRAGLDAGGHRRGAGSDRRSRISRRWCMSLSGSSWWRTASSTTPGPAFEHVGVELVRTSRPTRR